MMNGVHCQVSTTIRESNAVRCRVNHSTCPSPTEPSMLLTTPNCASSMNRQNSPTTIGASNIAGEMKATASPRSLRRVDRPGAGGVADVSCTGCSVVVLMSSASQPAATGVQHVLLLAGDLVEGVLGILGTVESRVDVGVLD